MPSSRSYLTSAGLTPGTGSRPKRKRPPREFHDGKTSWRKPSVVQTSFSPNVSKAATEAARRRRREDRIRKEIREIREKENEHAPAGSGKKYV